MARVPFLEKAFGQDAMVRTHRLVGFTSFNLLWAHIVLSTLGYASSTQLGIWGTLVDFVVNYPGMLLAVAGTVALTMVVATSIRKARARLRYETWHLLHLYAYLGVGLALPHQLWTGQDFVGNLAATVFWWTLYAVARRCDRDVPAGGAARPLPAAPAGGRGGTARDARRDLGRRVGGGTSSGSARGRGSTSSGGSSTARAGPAPTRSRCRPPRTGRGCGSRRSTSATARPGWTSCARGARVLVEGPVRTAPRGGPLRRQGPAHGVGHRGDPDAGAARGAAAGSGRRGPRSTGSTRRRTCCSGTSWPRSRRRRAPGS